MVRILVVEDEPSIAMVLREVLMDEGYEVEVAMDGHAAVALLSEDPAPDLVLTDLKLPYVSGAEIIEMMRRSPQLRGIPVVITTGSLVEELPPRESYQAFIQKPFDLVQVLEAVQLVLEPLPIASVG